MTKFAVMTFRHADGMPKVNVGIVGRMRDILNGGWRGRLLRPISSVYFKEDGREMGYILQLPDFIVNWDELSSGRRSKRLDRYFRRLEDLGIEVVCVPYYWDAFPQEIVEAMAERFVVDSAYQLRIFTLVESIKHLLGMLKRKVLNMEVGIWGADNWAGRLFAKALAPSINHMVLGGMVEDELYRLADEILLETGLACPITTDACQCLDGKQLVAVADECDLEMLSNSAIVAYAGALDSKYIEKMKSCKEPLWILSGWATLPEGVKADIELLPWETLGVLQALFLMMEQAVEVRHLLDTVKVRGFVLPEGGITYDTFRIRYLRKRA